MLHGDRPSATFLRSKTPFHTKTISKSRFCDGRLKVASGKLAAGTGFQIGFEGDGFMLVTKGDGGLEGPRTIFRSMRAAAFVMFSNPGMQIGCAAGVVTRCIRFTDENVNVMIVVHYGMPSRSQRARSHVVPARLRSRLLTAWQPSPSHSLVAKGIHSLRTM